MPATRPADIRFDEKVDRSGECWLWTGYVDPDGYPRFMGPARKMVSAHRFAYERFVGPIPEGLHLDHLCRVRHCVNPAHLEPVTPRENVLRGVGPGAINAAKTHCAHGHPFDDANTYRWKNNRCCRACNRRNQRKSAA